MIVTTYNVYYHDDTFGNVTHRLWITSFRLFGARKSAENGGISSKITCTIGDSVVRTLRPYF